MPRLPLLFLKLMLQGLVLGATFRLFLLAAHADQWSTAPSADILHALFDRGPLFDTYVLSWLLMLPALLLSIREASGAAWRWPVVAAKWWCLVLFPITLLLSCADIPFYEYTNMRLSGMALSTARTVSQSLKELVSTPPYLIALGVFLLLIWIVSRMIKRFFREFDSAEIPRSVIIRSLPGVLVVALLLCGMRGTFDPWEAPLSPEEAYFCETPFLNQLGTNATVSFASSLAEERMAYMPAEEAIENVRRELGIQDDRYTSPFARDVSYADPPLRRNIVMILVESLSANRLHRFGNPKMLMPFLESLMDSSLVLDRFYSAGTRTCNGIFSSLYGLPAVGEQHPLAHPSMTAQHFHGLPGMLRDAGYRTLFLYPGDAYFDNMNGFLPNNGFDDFIAEDEFADSLPRNSWGVTDHALYEKTMEELGASSEPFFATLMTISSHKGYNVPSDIPGFKPTSAEHDEDIYEYTDRALADFFLAARKAPWFNNTVFVILGDHGQRFDPIYEVPLAYHHVPLVIDAPGLAPGTDQGLGTQVDIPETIMGLLRLPHVNNTLGIDLLREKHNIAAFSSDERLCAINDHSYWIRTGHIERLYDHPSRGAANLAEQRPAELDSLRNYAMSMVQAAQWLVDERLLGKPVRGE